jgi:hypothetical protein
VYGDRETAWGDPGMPTEVIVPVFWHKTLDKGKCKPVDISCGSTYKTFKKKATNIFTRRNSVL